MSDDVPQSEIEITEVTVEEVRPLRSRYLRPHQPDEAVIYESDCNPTARHFVARDADGRLLGVASLCFQDRIAGMPPFGHPGMRMRGLAVEDDRRGEGIGAALVAHMLAIGQEAGIVEAWATAPTRSTRFYKRHRLRPMSDEFEVVGIGPHVVVARNLKPAKG